MIIKAVVCENCNYLIFSRNEDDYRECCCGTVSVRGGPNSYFKYETLDEDVKPCECNIEASLKELYDDFVNDEDMYGFHRIEELDSYNIKIMED